jgi:hypothetical protein
MSNRILCQQYANKQGRTTASLFSHPHLAPLAPSLMEQAEPEFSSLALLPSKIAL